MQEKMQKQQNNNEEKTPDLASKISAQKAEVQRLKDLKNANGGNNKKEIRSKNLVAGEVELIKLEQQQKAEEEWKNIAKILKGFKLDQKSCTELPEEKVRAIVSNITEQELIAEFRKQTKLEIKDTSPKIVSIFDKFLNENPQLLTLEDLTPEQQKEIGGLLSLEMGFGGKEDPEGIQLSLEVYSTIVKNKIAMFIKEKTKDGVIFDRIPEKQTNNFRGEGNNYEEETVLKTPLVAPSSESTKKEPENATEDIASFKILFKKLEEENKELKKKIVELEKKATPVKTEESKEKRIKEIDEKLAELRKKISELNKKYKSSTQKEEKASLYSLLEATQKESDKLEEELDSENSKSKKEAVSQPEATTKAQTEATTEAKQDEKEKKKIESLKVTVVLLLGQIKNGDVGSIGVLLMLINSQTESAKKDILPMAENLQIELIILLKDAEGGEDSAIQKLIIFININTPKTVPPIETTPSPIQPETQPKAPLIVEPMPTFTGEDLKKLNELRDLYLKAKRLRGNVFRGLFGRMFGRKIEFNGKKMDFGGKDGLLEVEEIRKEYQEKLSQYRIVEIRKYEEEIINKINKKEMTADQGHEMITQKIVDLLSQEQGNIDERAVNGIEKNIFEKMKTKWRQLTKTRLITGLLLGGAGALTGGTAVGAGIVGARAVMGGVGTYVGVEAGLEQYTKFLGHKGSLVRRMSKELKDRNFITDDARDKYLNSISSEDIKKEAARLRMLQVEKGVAINNLHTSGDEGTIAKMILDRDNALTAREAMAGARLGDPTLSFANSLSSRLAIEINTMNQTVEFYTGDERWKKMGRKTTALLAGGLVGWVVGGSLFNHETIPPAMPKPPGLPVFPPAPTFIDHTVVYGDSTWKIIENQLDAEGLMTGMDEGQRTHVIDAIKDIYAKMSQTELQALGWPSGNISILHPGNVIHLSSVFNNPEIMLKALSNAEHLSSSEITSIIGNNKTLFEWFVAHHDQLKANNILFDDKVTTKILQGKNVF